MLAFSASLDIHLLVLNPFLESRRDYNTVVQNTDSRDKPVGARLLDFDSWLESAQLTLGKFLEISVLQLSSCKMGTIIAPI